MDPISKKDNMFYSVYGTADVSSIHKTFAVVGNAPIIILPCGMG